MQRFLYKFQKLSLIWQFTLAVLLILFIPTILIMIIYIHTFQSSLLTQGKSLLQKDLNHLSYTMDSSFSTIDSAIEELVYQQEFPYFLNNKTTLSTQEQNYFVSNLRSSAIKFRNLNPYHFKHIVIYSSNTQIPESNDDPSHDFLWINRLLEATYVSDVLDNSADLIHGKIRKPEYTYSKSLHDIQVKEIDSLIIPVYRKIFSLNSEEMVGLIEINIALNNMVPADNLPDTESGVSYFLYDKEGNSLYPISGQEHPLLIEGDFSKETDVIQGRLDGEKYYFAYSLCNKTGMIKITAMPEKLLLQPVNSTITNGSLVVILALIIIIILTHLAIKLLLKRLSEMGQMIARIEVGDFDIHVDENGSDEISQIAKSFNKMGNQLQNTLRSLVAQEKIRQETELRALVAQINPHFLYNTLENMRMQCEIDEYYQVGDALAALGDLFRYSIKWADGEVPFALEWKNLKNYLSIMHLRHESNLIYTLEYGDDSGEMDHVTVPKFILQPLVENCFNHGFLNKIPPFKLYISANMDTSRLLITIRDNGDGISKERLHEIQTAFEEGTDIKQTSSHHSIGLHNVKQRIDMLCKKGSSLSICSEEEQGTTIHIHIVI